MNLKPIIIVLFLALAGGGFYVFFSGPKQLPNLVLQDAEGESVSLDELYENKEYLLMIFVLPNCPVSKFALQKIQEEYPNYSGSIAFVGLLFGNQKAAESFQEKNQIPFPVYGLREARDPFAINELIEKIGSSYGLRDAVWGGTVVVANREKKVQFTLEKEAVRELSDKLTDLVY